MKITFIGAGSLGFTRNLARDILTFPALEGATLCLMDIDAERLEMSRRAVQRYVEAGNYPAIVEATTDRRAALQDADAVLITVLTTPFEVWRSDIEIPKKYGVNINVGDTRGPSGVFRFLRTIPVMLDICKDIDALCPQAIVLNYTNPMAMLCRAMQEAYPNLHISGLCHSVQGTAEMLARWIGAPMSEITYQCAGINHQAFYLEYQWKGEDAYPLIRKALEDDPDKYQEELVRNEMLKALGYYVTESSGHNSEYNAWFRKREDLLERYCTYGYGWNPGKYGFILDGYGHRIDHWKEDFEKWLNDPETINLKRGHEYAASIINAVKGDGTPYKFNGNVRNFGLVDNLPAGCCVEVPVYADSRGLNPIHVGPLPPAVHALVNASANNEELAVLGSTTGDPELIYQSIIFDPLTAAVLSLKEIRDMVNEMFAASKDYLPQFRSHVTTTLNTPDGALSKKEEEKS